MRVAVIGAGIIGMSTAFRLKQVIPSADVCVYAKDFSPNLTSAGAAGYIRVHYTKKDPVEKIHQWTKSTMEYVMEKIRTDPNSGTDGLTLCSGSEVSREPVLKLPLWCSPLPLNFHKLSKEDLAAKFPADLNIRSGFSYQAAFVESKRYIPALMKKFKDMGGRVFKRELKSIGELYDECDILVNCTGLGSRRLVNDHEIYPVRGQVVLVKAPWIKEFCRLNDPHTRTYVYPNQGYIVLGGTAQENDWDLQPRKEDREHILENTAKLYPSLKKAEILGEWVGLRPTRSSVRLEKELLKVTTPSGEEKTMKVVHNYGQGSCGVTLHWGSAIEAANLVRQFVDETKSKM